MEHQCLILSETDVTKNANRTGFFKGSQSYAIQNQKLFSNVYQCFYRHINDDSLQPTG